MLMNGLSTDKYEKVHNLCTCFHTVLGNCNTPALRNAQTHHNKILTTYIELSGISNSKLLIRKQFTSTIKKVC